MQPKSKVIDGRRVIVKKPELLAPAGNLEKLKTAIIYGADAVFIGGKEFSLRSQASNFSIEDIKEAVQFANQYGAKIHVTCNIILHHDNLEGYSYYCGRSIYYESCEKYELKARSTCLYTDVSD